MNENLKDHLIGISLIMLVLSIYVILGYISYKDQETNAIKNCEFWNLSGHFNATFVPNNWKNIPMGCYITINNVTMLLNNQVRYGLMTPEDIAYFNKVSEAKE